VAKRHGLSLSAPGWRHIGSGSLLAEAGLKPTPPRLASSENTEMRAVGKLAARFVSTTRTATSASRSLRGLWR
jgi:hypothetical protein